MPKSKKPPAKAPESRPVPAKGSAAPAAGAKGSATAQIGKGSAGTSKAAHAAHPAAHPTAGHKVPVAPAPPLTKAAAAAKRAASVERAAKRTAEAARAKAAAASAAFDAAEAREPRKYPKGGPTKVELKKYRDKLLEMRRTLLSSSKELAAETLKSSGQDFSVDHMADHGSDNYEQDFSLKLLEGESEQLAEIRDALMKIDGKLDPPFGICEACGDGDQKLCETCPWIPPSRLDVLPHARLCVQTKEIEERRRG